MTPSCAAATAGISVVAGAQTKEYAHPYSMMHRRLTTAGIEVAPHYHKLLVNSVPAGIIFSAVVKEYVNERG